MSRLLLRLRLLRTLQPLLMPKMMQMTMEGKRQEAAGGAEVEVEAEEEAEAEAKTDSNKGIDRF